MQRLEVSGATRPIYGSLGVKWLKNINQIQGGGEVTSRWRQSANIKRKVTSAPPVITQFQQQCVVSFLTYMKYARLDKEES